MGLETGTYISDLVITNPDGADQASTSDDHQRLIKSVLKNTFPNANGAINPTPAEFNTLVGATSAVAEQTDVQESAYTYAVDSGTTNALVIALTPAPAALVAGLRVFVKVANTNTGASTLKIGALATTAIQKQDGNAMDANRLLAGGVYSFIYDGTAFILLSDPSATTGDARLTLKPTADTGWVMMDDGSIGSLTSGATTRANADTEPLYTLIWDNIIDTWAPVAGGRGASAALDFAANKALTLPRQLGRAIAISGTGTGLTARALGEYLGEENHQLTTAEMPSHSHGYNYGFASGSVNAAWRADSATPGLTTASAGSDTPHNTMQPSAFWNVMIKL